MTTERKTVVTLNKGVDGNRFMEEMNAKAGGIYIPDRSVEVWNEKPGSYSNYDFVMSKEEARELKNDSRVRDVRWGTKKECGYILAGNVYDEPDSYQRGGFGVDDVDRNWGLYACNQGPGLAPNEEDLNWRHGYTLTGKGVDIVISDDGVEVYHPDFFNPDGSSRVVLLDWPEASGLTYIDQDSSYYSAFVGGHGTHCASIIGGNLYGWARESNIYSLAVVNSTSDSGAPNWMFGISDSFNMLREWHLNKGTPTICNMSWTYYRLWEFDFFRYRGTTYTNRNGEYQYNNPAPQFGMRDDRHPVVVTSVASDVEDCIDAGVIMLSAAGNNYNYIDTPGGDDYDNYYERDDSFNTYHWCRGGTPNATTGVITAGNIDSYRRSGENKIHFPSGRGPGIDIWAPGTNIGAATSLLNSLPGVDRPYPPDPNFLMTKLTGTSFAAPQVCGVLAQHMELHPDLTVLEALQWLQENGYKDVLYDPSVEDIQVNYAEDLALNGAPNLFLGNPYTSGTVARYSGDIEISK